MKALNIILVDDNTAFRKALKMLLEKHYHAKIIAEASSAEEYLKLEIETNIDLIFMDIMMPEIDGIELTKKILWINNSLKIIAITMHNDRVYLQTLIEAGFVGCIFKNTLFTELPLAIKTIVEGKRYFPKNITIE